MRVISGRFKGRQLVSFDAGHIRPTTDRVKETLFNILMSQIEGARILDLFSGTGSLAIESISRGADWVDLVENHRKSLNIIRENMEKLEISDGYKIYPVDVFKYLKSYSGTPYDVILADPPFTKHLAHDLAQAISSSATIGRHSTVVIESSSQERLDDHYGKLKRLDQRGFGDKYLNFFELGEAHGESDIPR